ncbi:MAG: c-type cytochrome [Polyangiaceae bacterium]
MRIPFHCLLPISVLFACTVVACGDDPGGAETQTARGGATSGFAGGGGSSTAGGGSGTGGSIQSEPTYHSPYDVTYAEAGSLIIVSDETASDLAVLDAKDGALVHQVPLAGTPKGLTWSSELGRLFVTEYSAGTVAEIDVLGGTVVRRLEVGRKPTDITVSADGTSLLVTDFAKNEIVIVDPSTGAKRSTIPVAPYPFAVAAVPGGDKAVVTHLIASSDATRSDAASSVTVLHVPSATVSASVRLPFGSSAVHGVTCSPDGKWAYVVHTLGRTTVPTTHLFRGWINTNALSIIDLTDDSLYATVLLDRISEGAADPWGVTVSADGKSLWTSASGAHQILRVDLALLHQLLSGQIPDSLRRSGGQEPTLSDRSKSGYTRPLSDVWFEIAADPSKRSLLAEDLGALHGAGLLSVTRLTPAEGPRGIALSPDGKQLAVALYFAGQVGLLDAATASVERYLSVGEKPLETLRRKGERLFHDATTTIQSWLSCATCHPDGRADGLNWDLGNDGQGNPKNTKSLLYSPNTPPAMAHGVRASAAVAVTAGFKYIKFVMPEPGQELAVATYVNRLAGDPYRATGADLSESARRGEAAFVKADCQSCHTGKYTTDLKMHAVGTRNDTDSSADFDTPTLTDLWRTAPYLHDGSAATLKDVLTTKNEGDKHGTTSTLTPQELDDLVAYLLELDVPTPDPVELFPAAGQAATASPPQGVSPTPKATDNALDLSDPKLAVLDKILFIERDYLPTADHPRGGHMCDQYHGFNAKPGGGLFVLENVLSGNPTVRDVLANATCANGPHQGKKLTGGGFSSPDLHYDGKQILFAYTDIGSFQTWTESSTFHIFKVDADGTGLTQLTEGPHNDFDPTWLPDGRVVFISDRRGGFGRCHQRPVPVYTLHVMNADGSGIEPLSLHETNEWHPSVDNNGQIIYTRWDYVDRGSNQVHHGWITTPDGLDARAIGTNYATRANVTPRMLLNIRAIPGSNKLVGTATAHHQQAYGSLVVMDPDIEDDDGMAQYQVLTKDAGFPEATVGQNDDHKYATAWPIDEDLVLGGSRSRQQYTRPRPKALRHLPHRRAGQQEAHLPFTHPLLPRSNSPRAAPHSSPDDAESNRRQDRSICGDPAQRLRQHVPLSGRSQGRGLEGRASVPEVDPEHDHPAPGSQRGPVQRSERPRLTGHGARRGRR